MTLKVDTTSEWIIVRKKEISVHFRFLLTTKYCIVNIYFSLVLAEACSQSLVWACWDLKQIPVKSNNFQTNSAWQSILIRNLTLPLTQTQINYKSQPRVVEQQLLVFMSLTGKCWQLIIASWNVTSILCCGLDQVQTFIVTRLSTLVSFI